MIGANLMPESRRIARRRERRLRAWSGAGSVYAALLSLGVAILQGAAGARQEPLEPMLDSLAREQQLVEGELSRLKVEFTQVHRALAVSRAIADHPDWSVLLGFLASTRDEGVVLSACEVAPDAANGNSQGDRARSYTVRLAGLGRSQLAISQYVLRLEEAGLFGRVQLLETSPRRFNGTPMFGFRVECRLGDGGGRR